MARRCSLTGKQTAKGCNKSHSNRRTKREFRPNLFYRNIKDLETGFVFRVKLSTKAIKTLKKKGLL